MNNSLTKNPKAILSIQDQSPVRSTAKTLFSRCRLRLVLCTTLAMLAQTALVAQTGFELVNWYQPSGQTMSGAAALGLPGDTWNTFGASPVVDAQGNPTSISLSTWWYQWGGWGYADPVFVSDITRNLLTGYLFGGPVQVTISGLVPNTNYVLINYLSGNTVNSGGTVTWVDGAGNLKYGQAFNNPLTTKSNFIAGQNYVMLVGLSDGAGNIIYTNNYPPAGPVTWNGVQLQLAPDVPVIYGPPTDQKVFVGRTARFLSRSAGIPPLSFQWQFNGNTLSDGNGVSGATTPVLTYGNVSSSGVVSLIVGNPNGSATNSTTLTAVTPTSGSYAAQVNSYNPVAYWQLNEPYGSSMVYEYINGYKGTVGSGVTLGAAGVPNPPYLGFAPSHKGAQFVLYDPNSAITVPPLNFNTNTVTITAWIKPNGSQVPGAALFLTRVGTNASGLIYGPVSDQLGYTWNGEGAGWESGLVVPQDIWSFIALVIDPTKAALYVFNTNSYAAAVNLFPNSPVAWSAPAKIGSDPGDTSGMYNFNGVINDVVVYARALSSLEVFSNYLAGVGPVSVAPIIIGQPQSKSVSAGSMVRFNVVAIGTGPLSYQWKLNGLNLTNSDRIAGADTDTLTIYNVSAADVGNYTVVVTGAVAPPATSSPATLSIAARPLLMNVNVVAGGCPAYSGAGVVGQAGDVWNSVTDGVFPLLDYAGNPTPTTIQFVGGGRWDNTGGGSPTTHALMRSYRTINNSSASVMIAGLNNNAAYTIITYAAGDQPGQGATFEGGGLAGTTTGSYRQPWALGVNYLVHTNIVTDNSGRVIFTWRNAPTSEWGALNGLQIILQDISSSPPILAQQLIDTTNYAGIAQTLSVGRAVSLSAVSYQWFKGASPLSDGGNISGSRTATLTFNPLRMDDTGTYTCVVSNANGTASTAATLTVLDPTHRIYWSAPVPIGCPEQTLGLPGKLVYAATFGGLSNDVANYNFTVPVGGQSVTFDFTYNVYATVEGGQQVYNGGNVSTCPSVPGWDEMLGRFNADTQAGRNGQKTIRLSGLTAGLRYTAQLFALDARGGTIGFRRAYFADPVVPTCKSETIEMQDMVYIVGTFLAASETQDIIQFLPGNASGGDFGSGNMNAVVVRLAPPQVSITNNQNGTVTVMWDQVLMDNLTGAGPARLYSAPSLSGPWTDLGTSGSVVIPITDTQKFFRAVIP